MTIASHLVELRKKHQTLSEAVDELQKSPTVCSLRISKLKKRKLRLKDQITRLSSDRSTADQMMAAE
ncbi:MAG: DUF465 domain-containing protein [Candidatus Pacebacteria bacterium]|nr:DUF465 domain-containing protein [Candidatus Paceibacterota bacterium]